MRRWSRQLFIALSLLLTVPGVAMSSSGDPTMTSNNYSAVETEIGGNGCNNASGTSCGASSHYNFAPTTDDGGASLGESTVGNSASTNYQTNSGFNTTAQPGLTFIVTQPTVNLGTLHSSAASVASGAFSVKDYTSSGYNVTIIGNTLTNATHSLSAMGTQSSNSTGCAPGCASVAGSEQFGINMRQNSSPASVGSDPVPIPSAAFSAYLPAVVIPTPYQTAGQYRYFSGDTIASAPQSSGETDYTVSFMANISPTTPGGTYQSAMTLICTGSY